MSSNRSFPRMFAAIAWLAACSTAAVHAQTVTLALTSEMVGSVTGLLDGLSQAQRDMIAYAFDDPERLNWHFIPRTRNGLSFNEMDAGQQALATGVLQAFLSAKGYAKVEQIRSLESVLKEIEVNGRFVRDPNAYFLTVFGTPSVDGTWAFRLEGHHVAFNWTFAAGSGIASSPQFFGSNPAEVRDGSLAGLRVLGVEEDLGRRLVMSLDADQQRQAVLETTVPGDILSGADKQIAPLELTGVSLAALDPDQQQLLLALVEEVAGAQPDALAGERMARVRANDPGAIRFTWIGGTGAADGHYYRIQGQDFLIEYDKTQNEANHVHLVWRDFNGDFGRDLLRLHYDTVAAEFGPGHRH